MPESSKKVACSSPAVVAPHPTKSLNTPRLKNRDRHPPNSFEQMSELSAKFFFSPPAESIQKGHKNRDSHPLTSIEQMSELSAKFFFSPPAESIEKGEKRFTVADVLQLVNIKRQKMLDDTCSGVAQPAVYNKFDKQENIEENKESNHFSEVEKMPQTGTLFPPLPFGSRLVYMGNLHPAITESDVLEFFKDVGKVDWVKFMGIPDDRFGHVRFETYAASRKALKRDGEILIDRPVDLHAVEERTIFDVFTPCPGYNYLLMGNLNPDTKEEDIIKFFKDVGKVRSVLLICEDGHFLGHAHVEFSSPEVAYKAVQCYGQMLLGYCVELVLATEESIWYSRTPSIKKPRGYGRGRWAGRGPTLGPFCCNCTPYGAGRGCNI